ncbi:MAG: hypothetical protein JST80_10585 [Bdellovibrionales bacterium]|nr:hypothetical protein [Bdellovibrionales bacterium]
MQERKIGNLTWIDFTNPERSELEQVIAKYDVNPGFLLGCLDPDHLPQLDTVDQTDFLTLRAYDVETKDEEDSIHGLTRKITMVIRPDFLLTIHRVPLKCVQTIFDTVANEDKVVQDLIAKIIKTYDFAVAKIGEAFDDIEESILDLSTPLSSQSTQDLYTLKRRVTLLKRILRMTQEPVMDLEEKYPTGLAQDYLGKYLFQLEEIYDNLIAILSLQISISSQKTNEIMRVLTVYSILFMPLHLIAGIYGMNFEHMPELKWAHGYTLAISLMVLVAVGILTYCWKRGWIQRSDV